MRSYYHVWLGDNGIWYSHPGLVPFGVNIAAEYRLQQLPKDIFLFQINHFGINLSQFMDVQAVGPPPRPKKN
jgi:hypothetical protein